MELLQLRYFRDAAKYENFSKVAKKHMVPQPSISKTIKKLEKELGVQLFDRNGKTLTLNGNGKIFYQKINTALQEIDEGIQHFSSAKSNIILYPQAGGRFVSLLTADYLISHENIYLSTVNYSSDLENNYDFTFLQVQNNMSDYDYKLLMEDEIVAVVSNENPLSKMPELSLKDLANTPFVAHYRSMNLRDFTDNYCREQAGFTPNVVFETHDFTALRYMIEKNTGIALLPCKFFELQGSRKVSVIPLKEKVYRTLAIAWNKSKILNQSEKDFLDFVVNWFNNL